MEAHSEHSSVRQVTFIKSSGLGGTEAMYNWIGYAMHHLGNKDMLIVLPTLELRDRSFNPRLAKMLDESPALSGIVTSAKRDRANRADVLEYGARSRIIKAGANSPDSLRSVEALLHTFLVVGLLLLLLGLAANPRAGISGIGGLISRFQ